MTRTAREISNTGIYHIVLRGINKQNIFHDMEDKERFLNTLKKYKGICEYEIYGYCLMNNHIHILIKEGKETISQIMKRIGASYVYWYNTKYERSGHLFQGRFKSETVEDEKYLLTVLRYIHQNPTKAGIVEEIANYKWSSYNEYFNKNGVITDIDFVLSILNSDYVKAVKEFEEFMAEENKDKCLSYRVKRRKQLSDEHVAKLIKKIIKSDDIYILHNMNKNERNKIIKKLKQQGASIRQLARVTGLGRRIIEKA
ncbi:MAG TPA: transposase [Thermoanaerobacterales bacterium]|nr:transposase [Thermoanaerobacterales bacterium]